MSYFLFNGCQRDSSPYTGIVAGVVTLDGTPLRTGEIIFRDPDGKVGSAGAQIVDGKYSLKAIPAAMRVEIMDYRESASKVTEVNPGAKIPVIEQYIPQKYNEKSELIFEVQNGKNKADFELTSNSK